MEEYTPYYRYEDSLEIDEYDRVYNIVTCYEFPVIRKTKCGVWIATFSEKSKKFILEGEGKRYAYPTEEAAQKSFIKRKERQMSIYAARIERAKRAIAILLHESDMVKHQVGGTKPAYVSIKEE